jgi:cytochrome c peroxidase
MHDGIYTTLEEVIAHYDRGGGSSGDVVGVIDDRIGPLHLTTQEKADLVEFLKTLTGAQLPTALTSAPALPPATPF